MSTSSMDLPATDDPELARANPPGLSVLHYRVGTHGSFRQRMLAAMQAYAPDRADAKRPLGALMTRESDDPAIALIDAWATVGDVLGFYQERIVNEGFLRTASEPQSLLHLAQLVGHETDPGLAAAADLVFTVDDLPGVPAVVKVPAGTKVQSIPAQGQMPQTFETSELLEARAEWNELRPVRYTDQVISYGATSLVCKGTTTRLLPGNGILFVHWEQGDLSPERVSVRSIQNCEFRQLTRVDAQADAGTTLLSWRDGLSLTWEFDPVPTCFALRSEASLFGHNAPDPKTLSAELQDRLKLGPDSEENLAWAEFRIEAVLPSGEIEIDLERVFPDIQPGGWLVLVDGTNVLYGTVKQVSTVFRNDFLLSNQITRVKLSPVGAVPSMDGYGLRTTKVYFANEALTLAESPLEEFGKSSFIRLDQLVTALPAGRRLLVSGQAWSKSSGVRVAEFAELENCDGASLRLRDALKFQYVRSTVTISGNVVSATHGESVTNEVIGSGNAQLAFQRFRLAHAPLTYISSSNALGASSTLTIRVNGVSWRQVPSFEGATPADRVYVIRRNQASDSFVIFGDGVRGARLPTGQENVVASYRAGLGNEGNVDAGSLSLLQTRPLGVKAVNNPLPAYGGKSPESVEQTRAGSPRSTTTLGRIVTLRDVEDFVRAFPGIGKVKAAFLWTGTNRLVHLTAADVTGMPLADESAVRTTLIDAIAAAGNPWQRCSISGYMPRQFNVSAMVWVDRDYAENDVLLKVQIALGQAFAFERRDFGQPVTASEVITVIQSVAGVVAVDLDELYFNGSSALLLTELTATLAQISEEGVRAAELVTVNVAGITLTSRTIRR